FAAGTAHHDFHREHLLQKSWIVPKQHPTCRHIKKRLADGKPTERYKPSSCCRDSAPPTTVAVRRLFAVAPARLCRAESRTSARSPFASPHRLPISPPRHYSCLPRLYGPRSKSAWILFHSFCLIGKGLS